MADHLKDDDRPLVADASDKEKPVIDLLRAACWEKPTEEVKQPVKRLTKD